MTKAVVDGALLWCTQGTTPSILSATHNGTMLDGQRILASVLDHQPGTHLKPFGTCKVTHKPCNPSPAGPWGGMAPLSFGLASPLADSATLACSEGGTVAVLTDGGSSVLLSDDVSQALEAQLLEGAKEATNTVAEKLLFRKGRLHFEFYWKNRKLYTRNLGAVGYGPRFRMGTFPGYLKDHRWKIGKIGGGALRSLAGKGGYLLTIGSEALSCYQYSKRKHESCLSRGYIRESYLTKVTDNSAMLFGTILPRDPTLEYYVTKGEKKLAEEVFDFVWP